MKCVTVPAARVFTRTVCAVVAPTMLIWTGFATVPSVAGRTNSTTSADPVLVRVTTSPDCANVPCSRDRAPPSLRIVVASVSVLSSA
jgi:hypothetical protein